LTRSVRSGYSRHILITSTPNCTEDTSEAADVSARPTASRDISELVSLLAVAPVDETSPVSTGDEPLAPADEGLPVPTGEEAAGGRDDQQPAEPDASPEAPAASEVAASGVTGLPAVYEAVPGVTGLPAIWEAVPGAAAAWDSEDATVLCSRTRPSRMGIPRPPVRVPAPRSNLPRPVPRQPTRFGLVNRWDGLGYTPHGGHLRWLPEPAKDLVREGWECLPTPAKSVTVAVWRTGRAVRRAFWR
jgi:hypothetical protein